MFVCVITAALRVGGGNTKRARHSRRSETNEHHEHITTPQAQERKLLVPSTERFNEMRRKTRKTNQTLWIHPTQPTSM